MVKNLPVKQETWVQSLGQEDPLEKEMAAHSCILAWKIPWTEQPGGCSPWYHKRVRHNFFFFFKKQLLFIIYLFYGEKLKQRKD